MTTKSYRDLLFIKSHDPLSTWSSGFDSPCTICRFRTQTPRSSLTSCCSSQRCESVKKTRLVLLIYFLELYRYWKNCYSKFTSFRIAMIKRKAKPFKAVDFAKLAQKKYIDVNNALQKDSGYVVFHLIDFILVKIWS